jgi:hypothetical protein
LQEEEMLMTFQGKVALVAGGGRANATATPSYQC